LSYDAIVIGGGHNGLTCAAYLAMGGERQGRNKLKVLVLERREKVGGAAMSEEIHPGFTYSTCSYVCSLLRPEIQRFLDLPRHGLRVIPYDINATPNPAGEGIITYTDHDRTRASLRRHSIRDAEAYDHYAADIGRHCRFIKRFLMMTPPDPTALNPFQQNRINPWGRRADLDGFLRIGREFARMGERQMYEILRFWNMSVADFLDSYFENPLWKGLAASSSIIGTALGPYSPGTAYVLLHHYMGEVDGQIGAWGFVQGQAPSRAIAGAAGGRRRDPRQRGGRAGHRQGRQGGRSCAQVGRGDHGARRHLQRRSQTHLPEADREIGPRRDRSRHPCLCPELQDPRLLRQAQHRAQGIAHFRRPAGGGRVRHHRYRRRFRLHRARL
jgi:hypothetical protein